MQNLYRHWDKDDNLLYIGVSLSAVARMAGHKKDSPWFDEIVKVTIEKYETRQEAEAAEKAAIQREFPRHNVIHALEFDSSYVELCEPHVVINKPASNGKFSRNEYMREYMRVLRGSPKAALNRKQAYRERNIESIREKDRIRKAEKRAQVEDTEDMLDSIA